MSAPGANVTPIPGDAMTVFGQTIGCKGPLIIPVNLDMTAEMSGIIDFSALIQQDTIDFISGVYVDNKDGAQDIDFIADGTLARYTVYANRQSFFQMLPINPPKILWSTAGINNIIVPCFFGNIPWVPFNNEP